jgi:hypothetical protein
MLLTFDPKNYLVTITFDDAFLRISDRQYAVNSVNPGGSGRFHIAGQDAYYFASGLQTAKAEVYGSPDSGVLSHHQVHRLERFPLAWNTAER